MFKLFNNKKEIYIGAHRGSRKPFNDNTLEAIKYASQFDVDYYEIDIQYTNDNEIIVFHDTSYFDDNNNRVYITDTDYQTIRGKFQVNTLEEVLTWAKANNQFLAIELKSEPFFTRDKNIEMINSLLDLLNKYNFFDSCFIFGLDYPVLKEYKLRDSRINLGIISPAIPLNPLQLMDELDALIYLTYISNLTPELIDELHQNGYYVSASIVNDKETQELIKKYNIDMYDLDIYGED